MLQGCGGVTGGWGRPRTLAAGYQTSGDNHRYQRYDPVSVSSSLISRPRDRVAAPDRRYAAVARALAGDIREGAMADAAHLPSERALVQRFRVSRVTIRRALRELEADGLVQAAPGRGWLIRGGRLEEPENELLAFSAAAASRGLRATADVIVARSREATFEEAEALAVAPGSPVFRARAVCDGSTAFPVAIDWCLVPESRIDIASARTGDRRRSTLRSRRGRRAGAGDYVVRADASDVREARRLDLAVGRPCCGPRRSPSTRAAHPSQLCRMAYRGDRYRFRASLGRRPDQARRRASGPTAPRSMASTWATRRAWRPGRRSARRGRRGRTQGRLRGR